MAATGLVTVTVPRDYGYVVFTVFASMAVSTWHGFRAGAYRRAAGVPYPHQMTPWDPSKTASSTATDPAADEVAKKQYLFNCAQRGHANFLESYPGALAGILIGGLQYPIVASTIGGLWLVSRIVYSIGYTDPSRMDGKGRLRGLSHILFLLGLYGLTGMVGYNLLRA